MERDDLPVISLPSETTEAAEPRKPAGEQKRPPEPARPAFSQAAPPVLSRQAPLPPPTPPARVSPITVAAPGPLVAPPAPAVDDDPERLLREYAERQKTRVARLEQQIADLRRATAERDALRVRCEGLDRELGETRRQADAAAKAAEDLNRELQRRLDDALLSHSMISSENAKLKMRLQDAEAAAKKQEERAAAAERSFAESQGSLRQQLEARQELEGRVSAALQALQKIAPRPAAPPAPLPRK